MATQIKIREKSKQLTLEDMQQIYNCTVRGLNLTDTAKYIHCDISTVKKIIDRSKELKVYSIYKNNCGNKNSCNKHNVCGNSKCTQTCSNCLNSNMSCNEYCSDYIKEPNCRFLKKHCNVCNGCEYFNNCKLNKWLFDPLKSYLKHQNNLTVSRTGVRITSEEAIELATFLKPLLEKNISIETIKANHPGKIKYSVQTIYNWIEKGILPGIINLSLVRKVRYAKRKKYEHVEYNREFLNGRYYDDFIKHITENPYDEIVEMDCVVGKDHQSAILTLLFRRCNFMLAFKLKQHSSSAVVEIFDMIKSNIGLDNFKLLFKAILTDRGQEFSKPSSIEIDSSTGEVLTKVFFCDSRQSQQKGKIEKNHVELRKIFPKGFDFNSINQDQLNLALAHINSYPRRILGFKTPCALFKVYAPSVVMDLIKSRAITFNELNLSPKLIK